MSNSMKKMLFILLILVVSCTEPNDCPELIFDSLTKSTYLSNKEPYTGRCLFTFEDQSTNIRQYLNGKDYGKWIFYYPNGEIETKGRFNKNGDRVGKWKYYYESGELKQLSRYSKDGDRVGKWIMYNQDGEEIESVNY